MPRLLVPLAVCLLVTALPAQQPPPPPADAPPKGELIKLPFAGSKVFPGTTRDVTIYVPRQYDGTTPACMHVHQDGVQYNAPAVFDRLIHDKKLPTIIGVFATPGRVPALDGKLALDRFNRSYEYDGLGANYAKFVVDELLPWVETQKTADGRAIKLSKSGNDRSIGGASSGAVCAFTAAWERPDQFSRVFSSIGTYVGLRGAQDYPTLVRKVEPKPIRVFLEDGSNDLNIYGGDWWIANQAMERSLTFAGYEVKHQWGDGGHDGKLATKLFPEAMTWLWQGWPAAVKPGAGSQQLREVVRDGEGWREEKEKAEAGYNSVTTHRSAAYSTLKGVPEPFAMSGSNPAKPGSLQSFSLVRLTFKGFTTDIERAFGYFTGLTTSPDQSLLYVADADSHWVYSYQIQPDGTLKHKQKFFHLHTPDDTEQSGAGGMCCDTDGRLYVATTLGVQVCDQAGRVNFILPLPGNAAARSVAITTGPEPTLVVTAGDKVFARKVKVPGALPAMPPTKPKPPKL